MKEKAKKNRFTIRFNQETCDWIKKSKEEMNISYNELIEKCVEKVKKTPPEVKISDFVKEVHVLKIALNSVGIECDYLTTDLIFNVIEKLKEKGGQMDISDSALIQAEHREKWNVYFKVKDNE
jgi:hypothetical protein